MRVLEANRSALKDVGFNISATDGVNFALAAGSGLIGPQASQGVLQVGGSIGSADIDVVLQALEQKGVIRTLRAAQPCGAVRPEGQLPGRRRVPRSRCRPGAT